MHPKRRGAPRRFFFVVVKAGCTAMVNLGFLLLRILGDHSTKTLSTLTFINARSARPDGMLERVDDASITDFCRANNAEIIPVEAEGSDCQYWSE